MYHSNMKLCVWYPTWRGISRAEARTNTILRRLPSLISWSLTSSTKESSTLKLRISSVNLCSKTSSWNTNTPSHHRRIKIENVGYTLVRRRVRHLISGRFRCISWRRLSFPLPGSTGNRSDCGPCPGTTREPTECMWILQRNRKWCKVNFTVTQFSSGRNTFDVYREKIKLKIL